MIKILSAQQIREADQFIIKNEPIDSIDLMERASEAFVTKFLAIFSRKQQVKIFCGTGNNGGDGLAIGRLLKESGWNVSLYIIGDPQKGSEDFRINLDRSALYAVLSSTTDFPEIDEDFIVIDALFGSGLSRPTEGIHAELIAYLNDQNCTRVSVDIASGLYSDEPTPNGSIIFQPHFTLSFQVPKLAFFLPDCHLFVGDWFVLVIGLDQPFIDKQDTKNHFSTQLDFQNLLPVRSKFTHKSQSGKLLIVAGSKGKMGAAVLCARASFKAGVGLVNICSPKCGTSVLQISIPEAMVIENDGEEFINDIPKSEDTIAVGPGLGTNAKTSSAFDRLVKRSKKPLVIDADGLNILARRKSLLKHLPEESILTPHPGEFKRLVGDWENDFERLEKLRAFCTNHKVNMVLKGAYSSVCDSKGHVHFNPSGNSAMATAGSGDVLTGIIGAFLSQGIEPFDALKLGVYVHGLAGDLAVEGLNQRWIQASDIISSIPSAVGNL